MKMNSNQIAVDTYNHIAHQYSDQYFSDLSDAPQIDKLLGLLPKGGSILDVGCGPGQYVQYIESKGFMAEGIDYSEEMVKIARKKVKNGIFKQMDMRSLEYPDNFFNGILAAYSIIHIPTKEIMSVLEEFYRVLRENGKLLIITQEGESDRIVQEPFDPQMKMFFNLFSESRLRELLIRCNLQLIEQFSRRSQDYESIAESVIYTYAQKSK